MIKFGMVIYRPCCQLKGTGLQHSQILLDPYIRLRGMSQNDLCLSIDQT